MNNLGNQGVPQTGDTVLLDPASAFNGVQGANTSSTDDIGALTLGELDLNPQFTQEVTLGDNLEVTGTVNINCQGGAPLFGYNLNLAGDTLSLGYSMTTNSATFNLSNGLIGPAGGSVDMHCQTSFNWTGGESDASIVLENDGGMGNAPPPAATMTISGNNGKTFQSGSIVNYGTITWSGGNIASNGTFENAKGATFNITTDSSLTTDAGLHGDITNAGTFQKTAGAGTTSITGSFDNEGYFNLLSGTVNLGTGQGYYASQGAGVTTLNGGNLSTSSTYYVSGGMLTGVGTVSGNLSTDNSSNNGQGGGMIKPGLNGAPGNLNVVSGNYTQTANGRLYITVNSAGAVSLLNIQGGRATLTGALYVANAYAQGATNLTFLQYGSETGFFTGITITNAFWTYQGTNYRMRAGAPGAASEQLLVTAQ